HILACEGSGGTRVDCNLPVVSCIMHDDRKLGSPARTHGLIASSYLSCLSEWGLTIEHRRYEECLSTYSRIATPGEIDYKKQSQRAQTDRLIRLSKLILRRTP